MINRIRFFIVFNLLIQTFSFGKGYRIDFQLAKQASSPIFLAHYYGDKIIVVDSIRMDENNSGYFKGDSLLDQGIYLLATKKSRFFDFLVGKNQCFSIDASESTNIGKVKISKSKEAQQFLFFQQKMELLKKNQIRSQKYLKSKPTNTDSISFHRQNLKELDYAVNSYWENEITKNKNTFYGKFIQSMMVPSMPPSGIPENHAKHDSLEWIYEYNWRKDHFLDHIDFTDERLLRTPIFHQKISLYFNKLLLQIPDSINKQTDLLLSKTRKNIKMYHYLANYFLANFSSSKIMGMDASFVHVAENHYLNGEIKIDSAMYAQLYREVLLLKPTLLGVTAKDLVMADPEGVHHSLHQTKGQYTVLVFWEPNCGHCEKQIPQLYNEVFLPLNKKGIEVFAVYTMDKKEEWIEFIQKKRLYDWINVYDPEKLSHFRIFYKIESTPAIYILDKDKKIVAKNIDIPTVRRWLDNQLKSNKN